MTVRELLHRTSSRELTEWAAYLELEDERQAQEQATKKAAEQHDMNRRRGLR